MINKHSKNYATFPATATRARAHELLFLSLWKITIEGMLYLPDQATFE